MSRERRDLVQLEWKGAVLHTSALRSRERRPTTSSHVTEFKLGFTVKYISQTVARLLCCSLIDVLKGGNTLMFHTLIFFFHARRNPQNFPDGSAFRNKTPWTNVNKIFNNLSVQQTTQG